MDFIPRPLVANMSYMSVNVGNPFATTLGGQVGANHYANQIVPTHVGLSK